MDQEVNHSIEEFTDYTFQSPEYYVDDSLISEEHQHLLQKLEENNKMPDTIFNKNLKFSAGYVAYRFNNKYTNLNLGTATKMQHSSTRAPEWVEFISKGNLIYLSNES